MKKTNGLDYMDDMNETTDFYGINDNKRYIVTQIKKFSRLKGQYLKSTILFGILTTLSVLGLAKGVSMHYCTTGIHMWDILNVLTGGTSLVNIGLLSGDFNSYCAYKMAEADSHRDYRRACVGLLR